MADTKISALPASTTPLAGTEVLPIVQSGVTVKVSVANLTAGRAISASGVTVTGGTANGVGYLNGSQVLTTEPAFRFDGTNLSVNDASSEVTDGVLRVRRGAAGYTARLQNTSATTPSGLSTYYSGSAPNNTGSPFIYAEDTSTLRMSVRSNGGIANYAANNVVLSDRREKTNFAPAKSYLDVICAVPVQTYNYIDQNLEEDGGLTLGVVAQDVQAVAPELVTESNWGTKDQPKIRLEIYQTDLQYALMKCIQEQQTLITQLASRVTALEGT
jgi:hypothetical protein